MIGLPEVVDRASLDLQECGFRFAVVGGLAVGVHSEPRFTRDVDLAVASSGDSAAEELTIAMFRRGYQLIAQLENKPDKRLRAVRLRIPPPEEGPILDLLFAVSGIENEVVADAEAAELFPGQTVPVAKPADLIAMKILALDNKKRRHFDTHDIEALLKGADSVVVDEIHQRLTLMEQRGWSRGRNLHNELDQLIERFRNTGDDEFQG